MFSFVSEGVSVCLDICVSVSVQAEAKNFKQVELEKFNYLS